MQGGQGNSRSLHSKSRRHGHRDSQLLMADRRVSEKEPSSKLNKLNKRSRSSPPRVELQSRSLRNKVQLRRSRGQADSVQLITVNPKPTPLHASSGPSDF